MFIWLVFRSCQYLISTLTQSGGGGLLFRFACSAMLWGGRGTADKHHWRVWGVLAVFRPHWACPCSQHVCVPHLHCSGSRLLYRERALELRALPRPKRSHSGSWVLHKGPDSVGPVFCAFPVGAAQATRSLTSALSPGAVGLISSTVPASVSGCTNPVHLVSLLGS